MIGHLLRIYENWGRGWLNRRWLIEVSSVLSLGLVRSCYLMDRGHLWLFMQVGRLLVPRVASAPVRSSISIFWHNWSAYRVFQLIVIKGSLRLLLLGQFLLCLHLIRILAIFCFNGSLWTISFLIHFAIYVHYVLLDAGLWLATIERPRVKMPNSAVLSALQAHLHIDSCIAA